MRFFSGLCLITLLSMTGCARIAIHRTRIATPVEKLIEENYPIWAFGIVQTHRPLVLTQRCTHSWESFTSQVLPLQVALHMVTLNIYAPWTADLECAASKPAPRIQE